MKKTLLLNPPSYDDFDGGAGSRYQATREVWSFWYPTWLCYPAAMIPGSRVLDAPPLGIGVDETVAIARDVRARRAPHQHAVVPRRRRDRGGDQDGTPRRHVAMVGGHPTAEPERSLREAPAVDLVIRKEFDHAVAELAAGGPVAEIAGVSHRAGDAVVHNPEAVRRSTGGARRAAVRHRDLRARPRLQEATTVRTASTRTSRSTPAAAVPRVAPSACGPR